MAYIFLEEDPDHWKISLELGDESYEIEDEFATRGQALDHLDRWAAQRNIFITNDGFTIRKRKVDS